jgi:hypothetical protein
MMMMMMCIVHREQTKEGIVDGNVTLEVGVWDGREIIGIYMKLMELMNFVLKCMIMVMVMVIITWLDVAHGYDDPY